MYVSVSPLKIKILLPRRAHLFKLIFTDTTFCSVFRVNVILNRIIWGLGWGQRLCQGSSPGTEHIYPGHRCGWHAQPQVFSWDWPPSKSRAQLPSNLLHPCQCFPKCVPQTTHRRMVLFRSVWETVNGPAILPTTPSLESHRRHT